jgi:WASH complex subunit FAM21
LLPTAAPQISGAKPISPEFSFPSSEAGRSHSLESVPALSKSGEAGVSFDLPAQADTLHSANKVMKPSLLFAFLCINYKYTGQFQLPT